MVELVEKELPELEGKWGVAPLPKKESRTSFVGGCNLVVFKDSKKKELAWKFIEFMCRLLHPRSVKNPLTRSSGTVIQAAPARR